MATFLNQDEVTMEKFIKAVELKGGYTDCHTYEFNSAEKFAGVCMKDSGELAFLINAPIFSLNAVYIDENGMAYLSKRSVSGVWQYGDLHNKENWSKLNETLLFSKIKEVLLKDGTCIKL